VVFFGVMIPVWYVVIWNFRQQGLSKQIRKLLMKRQLSYMCLMMVCQSVTCIGYLHIKGKEYPTWLLFSCALYFSSAGFIYSYFRLSDPIVTNAVKDLFTCKKRVEKSFKAERPSTSKMDDLLLEDTLSSFLTSQLNVELVYVILTGITTFTEDPTLSKPAKVGCSK